MGILIPRELSQQQYIKLFSNPVSGIACNIATSDPYSISKYFIKAVKDIRYSKSMILKALNFWRDYTEKYYSRVRRIWSPLNLSDYYIKIHNILMSFSVSIGMVERYPDSYLFSHRYIKPSSSSKTNSLKIQRKLLQDKLGIREIEFQEGSLQPYYITKTDVGIEFTVFPCEHPYIPKQKITKVGMTDKGNVFILHKNGAQKHREMMDIHRKITGENKK